MSYDPHGKAPMDVTRAETLALRIKQRGFMAYATRAMGAAGVYGQWIVMALVEPPGWLELIDELAWTNMPECPEYNGPVEITNQ